MFRLIKLLAFTFIAHLNVYSQSLSYLKIFQGNANDSPGDILLTHQDELIISGNFNSDSLVIGTETLYTQQSGNYNTFFAKLDTNGNCLWAKVIFSTTYSNTGNLGAPNMAIDINDNIFFAGVYSTTIDIDPGNGVYPLNPIPGYKSFFLAKYTPEGDLSWGIPFSDSAEFINDYHIRINNDQDIIFSGNFASLMDFDPSPSDHLLQASTYYMVSPFISKYTNDGNLVWAYNMDTPCQDMTIDKDNNIIITSNSTYGDLDFASPNEYVVPYHGSMDFVLAKYSPNADLLWGFSCGGWYNESGDRVVTDSVGNIYATGFMRTPVYSDFDPSPSDSVGLVTNGSADVFVAKYSPDGNFLFANNVGGLNDEYVYDCIIDDYGHLYWIMEYWSDGWDGDFSDSVNIIQEFGGGDDFIMSSDLYGKTRFSFSIATPVTDSYSRKLKAYDNGFYILGWYNGNTVDFDPSPSTYTTTINSGDCIFLAKYAYKNGTKDTSSVSLINADNPKIQIENPLQDHLLKIQNILPGSTVSMYNLQGKELFSQKVNTDKLYRYVEINSGIYLLKIEQQGQIKTIKIQVE